MNHIDRFLNKITMYRLVLYCLIAWLAIAGIFAGTHLLSFSPEALLYSTAVLLVVCLVTNQLFTKAFNTHANIESTYITALILALLITPPLATQYISILPFLIWASVLAMASKFILAIFKKHIFNPAAIALVVTAIFIDQSATWWIGTLYMLPLVAIGGLLIVRKIRRTDLVVSFFVSALISIIITSGGTTGFFPLVGKVLAESPIIFFATVMLTEPLTTPPTRSRRILYGIIVGAIFAPNIHIGTFYSTPELALVVGNLFSWLMSPKRKFMLKLTRREKIAADTGQFVFAADHAISFKPGQYLEWTLAHAKSDSRGNRRYFTIASSPTENNIRLGVKFAPKRSSSFKKALAEMDEGGTIMAGQLSGDFTLPRDSSKKLCFIAGGIGVTPFRSMIRYVMDTGKPRDIILVYSVNSLAELSYTELFKEAKERIELKTVATLTDKSKVPTDWKGHTGFVSADILAAEVPDYLERIFYISGPQALVDACKEILKQMNVPRTHIKTDYFPGF